MKLVLVTVLASVFLLSQADKPAYKLYNSKGKAISYEKMTEQLSKADIILFGEYHNNSILHWLQLQFAKDLAEQKGELFVMGSEVFERDVQGVVDEYLKGMISLRSLKNESKAWPNFETDYLPLIELAKSSGTPFIATNIPRRYASMVAKGGFEALDKVKNKEYIAPLPITVDFDLPSYKGMLDGMAGHGHGGAGAAKNMVRAQASKDATMAYSILQNWEQGQLFYHINGSYHSDNHEGIAWHLQEANPKLKIVTISITEAADDWTIEDSEFKKADFVIAVHKDMTKTH